MTIAGGHGKGNATNHLHYPCGLFVDDRQTVYIADYMNHRIIASKVNLGTGQLVAGDKGAGDRLDQLNEPTDVIVDPLTNTLLICDSKNRRVMRWPLRPSPLRRGEIVIDNISCRGLRLDDQGALYVTDGEKHEVRRYDGSGDKTGTLVAGGHGAGNQLNQLNGPTYLFVDAEFTVYVSDSNNHRVMAWKRGATEGIAVAGGNGQGRDLAQLSFPKGVWVDGCGHVYVADFGNDRVMRWEKGATQGEVIVGGHEQKAAAAQLSRPEGLFFNRQGDLYVADFWNDRVQRFTVF